MLRLSMSAVPHAQYFAAKRHLSLAIDAENKGNHYEALQRYREAVNLFDKLIASSNHSRIISLSYESRAKARERIQVIGSRSNKDVPDLGTTSSTISNAITAVTRLLPSKETILKALKNVTSEAVERVLNEILDTRSPVTFDDIAGNERAKQILNEILILPILRPELFRGLRSPARGVLLFGPPGNGKTMVAKAVANEAKCTFFNISAASIFSKWVGESENLVRALFAVARHVQPSIIFLDEVETLLTAREDSKGSEVSRRVLTQLLAEMDGVGSGSERILILAATNRPQELDDAALRRLPRRVYVRMPDLTTRVSLLTKLLSKGVSHSLTPNDIRKVAASTDGYSASDLKELAKEAALGPIRELNATKLRTIDAKDVRPVSLKDFSTSLQHIRPSTSRDKLAAYEQWNSQFGESNNNGTSRASFSMGRPLNLF